MTTTLSHDEQRARDALLFEPMPNHNRIRITELCIEIICGDLPHVEGRVHQIPGARRLSPSTVGVPFGRFEYVAQLIPFMKRYERNLRRQQAAKEALSRRCGLLFHCEAFESASFQAMRSEFINERGPIIYFEMEAISHNDWARFRHMPGFPTLWGVWKIVGRDLSKWRWEWQEPRKDYSNANSVGSRGIMLCYDLWVGPMYRILRMTSGRVADPYFATVINRELVTVTEKKVLECLESKASESASSRQPNRVSCGVSRHLSEYMSAFLREKTQL